MSDAGAGHGSDDLIGTVPGLLKVAASAWWHTTGWTVGASLRGSRRLVQAALSPDSAAELARDVQDAARRYARGLADLGDVEQDPGTAARRASANGTREGSTLRRRGEDLLRKSRDVRLQDESHPAYERILSELAPDEGRILLLMLTKGPQPAIDIRTGGPLGLVRSRLIAPGLSMIGDRAGCRYTARVPSYLHNLYRLGLIWFSRETIQDPLRYQVLEAQPDVLEAIHSVRQAKVVRRSIHLTPFGEDFCRTCLPLEPSELTVLPEHGTPDEPTDVTQPPAP
jgi:hypothetical protein